jgi:hypothetical protein
MTMNHSNDKSADHRADDGEDQLTGKRSVSRREFLRIGATASAGLAASRLWVPAVSRADPTDTSRVVVVTDEQVLDAATIQPDIVRIMIDEGIKALTGATTSAEAWLSLFPDLTADLAIGLKINTINSYLSSHPEVTLTIAESLAETPIAVGTYPENQMLIWDRWGWELLAAGYSINTSSEGVRCFATDTAGIGYFPSSINVNGSQQRVSRCYTDYSDCLINMCLLRNHTISGVTHALKNHYGTINNPNALHSGHCDPFIPDLNLVLFETHGPRQKLCVCDAIYGIRYGGPMGYPQFIYNGLLFATDPVAMDAVCRQILDEYGSNTIHLAHYIDTAGAPPYNLGNSDLANIERIDIVNPSNPTHGHVKPLRPHGVRLRQNYPEPFSNRTSIPLSLEEHAEIQLDIVDMMGRRVTSLHSGALSAGDHEFTWNVDSGISSGGYVVKLRVNGHIQSKVITLVR